MTSNTESEIAKRLESYRHAFDLSGKTAVVLGAASGIGKASAEALAALGAHLICADIDQKGVEATAADIKGKAHRIYAGRSEDIKDRRYDYLHLLSCYLRSCVECHSRDIAARPRKTLNEARSRITDAHKDDGDPGGRILSCLSTLRCSRNNDIHFKAHYFRGKLLKTIVISTRIPTFNKDVLTFNPT